MLSRSLSHTFQPGEYDPTEWRRQREDFVRVTFEDSPAARVADINARMAQEQADQRRYGNVAINVAIAAILALLLIGAITPQAVENITEWRVSHEPV